MNFPEGTAQHWGDFKFREHLSQLSSLELPFQNNQRWQPQKILEETQNLPQIPPKLHKMPKFMSRVAFSFPCAEDLGKAGSPPAPEERKAASAGWTLRPHGMFRSAARPPARGHRRGHHIATSNSKRFRRATQPKRGLLSCHSVLRFPTNFVYVIFSQDGSDMVKCNHVGRRGITSPLGVTEYIQESVLHKGYPAPRCWVVPVQASCCWHHNPGHRGDRPLAVTSIWRAPAICLTGDTPQPPHKSSKPLKHELLLHLPSRTPYMCVMEVGNQQYQQNEQKRVFLNFYCFQFVKVLFIGLASLNNLLDHLFHSKIKECRAHNEKFN